MSPEQRKAMATAIFNAFHGKHGKGWEGGAEAAWQAAQPWVREMVMAAAIAGWHAPEGFGTDEDFDSIVARVMEGATVPQIAS